jgi:hypothetical protein
MRRLISAVAVGLAAAAIAHAEPFADRVVAFTIGTGGGAGEDALPAIVLGPPRGSGAFQGSLDTLSLGLGGTITLAFDDNVLVDGPGPDLLVFENAFLPTGLTTLPPFAEPAVVEVSGDGADWHAFACASTTGPFYAGCAGVYPVFANAADPAAPSPLVASTTPIADLVGVPVGEFVAPAGAGGDAFDLADVGLFAARFVRLTASLTLAPGLGGLSGSDVDALAAVHSVDVAGVPDTDGDGYPDVADACPAVSDPEQRDADGDGLGDACEGGGGACGAEVTDAKLTLAKLKTPPGDDGLSLTGTLAPLAGGAPDPLAHGVRVIVIDAASATLLDVVVPGGAWDKSTKTGWKVKGATATWQGVLGGLTKVKLAGKTPGTLKLAVTGKGAAFPAAPALPLGARLLVDGDPARCGATAFAAADCVAQTSKGKVTCKSG